MDQTIQIKRPFDDSSLLEDDVEKSIFELPTMGPDAMHARRQAKPEYYEKRARALEAAEAQLHAALSQNRANIIAGKRLLLFKQMCVDAGVEEGGDPLELQPMGVLLTGVSAPASLLCFQMEQTYAACEKR